MILVLKDFFGPPTEGGAKQHLTIPASVARDMRSIIAGPLYHERKKHPKKICIKNFGGTLAGGSRRGLRRPNSLCRCWFSQQNTVPKEFRGGVGLRGSWGWGLRFNFGAPFLYVYVLFWGVGRKRVETEPKTRKKVEK